MKQRLEEAKKVKGLVIYLALAGLYATRQALGNGQHHYQHVPAAAGVHTAWV